MMKQIVITRNQFQKLKEVFEMYKDVTQIVWSEESPSGIGPTVTIEFEPKGNVKLDITDVSNW